MDNGNFINFNVDKLPCSVIDLDAVELDANDVGINVSVGKPLTIYVCHPHQFVV